MNKVIISGRLSKEPDTRYSQGDEPIAVTRISVAVNRKFKKDGEQSADFINCIAFGKTAEFISKYFSKGKMIGIIGNIRNNSWTDQSGQKKYSTEVYIEEVEFLESKSASENSQRGYDNYKDTMNNNPAKQSDDFSDDFYSIESDIEDDDLPF